MEETINNILNNFKGVLATDATEDTMNKRMEKEGITPTPDLRTSFRELLLTTPYYEDYVGGVILNDEIIRQKTSTGVSFPELISGKKVMVGIKVDKKCHPMPNYKDEKIAEGLDGLRERLAEYKEMGATFAKFRAVISINEFTPTRICIDSNAHALARYAAHCMEAGIVPIVEPEVVMDGAHDLERCAAVTTLVLRSVFYHLNEQLVDISKILLKPNIVLPGKDFVGVMPTDELIAQRTIEVMKATVPEKVPGILFLSGGQSASDATNRLNEMVKLDGNPWALGFSFERALEGPALTIWQGKEENKVKAQEEFIHRCKMNSLARKGEYNKSLEENRN